MKLPKLKSYADWKKEKLETTEDERMALFYGAEKEKLTLRYFSFFLAIIVLVWIFGTLYMSLTVPLVQNTNENSITTSK